MIKLEHVTKEYARRGKALNDVSLEVKKGEFAFLTGHSGSGKSTTLRLIHMADFPTEGEILVCGFSSRLTTARDVWKLRRRVGFVFQEFRLLPGRTALENVTFALEVTGTPRKDLASQGRRLLGQVGLSVKSGMQVHELSGGEQQRVAIARALANDPSLLLADEPTGNLDSKTGHDIVQLLSELSDERGVTVVSATHDHRMLDVSDRVVYLRDGRVERIARREDLNIQVGSVGE